MNAVPPVVVKPKRRKWFWRVLWSMAFVFIGAVGYWCWCYWSALSERDALIAEIRARGEPVWWEELCDKLVKESPPDSGAPYFLAAIEKLPPSTRPNQMRTAAYVVDKRISAQFADPKFEPEIQSDLKAAAESFALLEEAVKRPPGFLSAAFLAEHPFDLTFDHLSHAREFGRLFRWDIYDALSKDDPARAYRTIKLGFKTSQQYRYEKLGTTILYGWSLFGQQCTRLKDVLRWSSPSAEDYKWLDGLLAKEDHVARRKDLMIADRAFWLSSFDRPDRIRRMFDQSAFRHLTKADQRASLAWVEVIASPLGRPLLMKSQSEYIRAVDRQFQAMTFPIDPDEPKRIIDEYRAKSPLVKAVDAADDYTSGTLGAFEFWYRLQWRIIITRLVLRLRRHYDSSGRFPDALEEVCDDVMPRIPIEWFLGHPLVYKPKSDGFLLDVSEAAEHRAGWRLKPEYESVSPYGVDFKVTKMNAKGAAK